MLNENKSNMRFIDLFAGLGGFHTGLSNCGYECVFACEIEPDLQSLYHKNYGIKPHGDITKINAHDIPEHDIICAGFPCQPFSLAGKKKGASCPSSGKLIDDVVRIANHHKPKIILLENVPNIKTIANGTFWEYLTTQFSETGYNLHHKIISPVDVGIPQNRKRIFIVAIRKDLDSSVFNWPTISLNNVKPSLEKVLDSALSSKKLESAKIKQIEVWQTFLENTVLPERNSYSVVAQEFGANYPLDFHKLTLKEIKKYKGAYGQDLSKCHTWSDIMKKMPSYTQKERKVANWIKESIPISRNIYANNHEFINQWIPSLNKKNNSWQTLEWRGTPNTPDLNKHIIQFRASGIRVLKPEIAPSLIAMTPTQIPIIPSENRYISHHEAAKLQFLHKLKFMPQNTTKAFKAFGNAVNARIIELIGEQLKEYYS